MFLSTSLRALSLHQLACSICAAAELDDLASSITLCIIPHIVS